MVSGGACDQINTESSGQQLSHLAITISMEHKKIDLGEVFFTSITFFAKQFLRQESFARLTNCPNLPWRSHIIAGVTNQTLERLAQIYLVSPMNPLFMLMLMSVSMVMRINLIFDNFHLFLPMLVCSKSHTARLIYVSHLHFLRHLHGLP